MNISTGGVGLASFDVWLDVNRRHQFHLMTQRLELARPEVARAARLDTDETGLQLGEERHHLAPAQRSPDDDLAGAVDAVDLKNVLGQIEADGADIHNGWLLLLVVDDNHHCGTSVPGAGAIHPICYDRKAEVGCGMSVTRERSPLGKRA